MNHGVHGERQHQAATRQLQHPHLAETSHPDHYPPMDFRISDITKAMYYIACSVEIEDASARA